MAEIKVSQLPEATQINDDDLIMIVQSGTNKKITKANARFASGDEISIGTTEPTEEEKLWINPEETPSGALNPITNEYSVAQDKGYSCEYSNEHYGGVVLYENANGTTGNVTLSETIANFNYLEIEYVRSGYAKSTGKIKANATPILDGYWYYYDSGLGKNVFQNYCEIPSISGTTITRSDTYYTNVVGDGGGTYTGNFAGGILITRVVGYK